MSDVWVRGSVWLLAATTVAGCVVGSLAARARCWVLPAAASPDLAPPVASSGTSRALSPAWLVPVTGLLWAAVAWWAPSPQLAALGWGLSVAALLAAAIDLEQGIIPNRLNAAAALLWVPLGVWSGRWAVGMEGALAFGGILLVLALARPGGMGMGDVKLGAVLGLYLGWRLSIVAFLFAAVAGALAGLVLMAWKLKGPRDTIPFGPCLALGALLAYLAGQALVHGVTGV